MYIKPLQDHLSTNVILILQGQLDIPARILLEEVFYRVEGQPTWNPLTTECKIVKVNRIDIYISFEPKLYEHKFRVVNLTRCFNYILSPWIGTRI